MRAFYPESGSVKFVIHDAHSLGVTAVCASMRGDRIITGGADGKVRFWDSQSLKMISSLCEHKTKVSFLFIVFVFLFFLTHRKTPFFSSLD